MECSYFGKCGSCTLYTLDYNAQVAHKEAHMADLFASLHVKEFDFFASPSEHYRGRSEFRIWKEGETIQYAMGTVDKKGAVCIETCPKVEMKIYALMPQLLKHIERSSILHLMEHL